MSDANETLVLVDSAFQIHCCKNSFKLISIEASGNEKKHTSGILAVNALIIKFQPYEVF